MSWSSKVTDPRPLFLAAGLLAVGHSLRADLVFSRNEVALQATEGGCDIEAVFPFTNTGETTVRITDVKAGCGCTTLKPDREVYASGESGAITAVYRVGERKGPQSVSIHVTTEGESSASHELHLNVNVLSPVNLSPRLVYWRVGENPEAKAVQVDLADGFSIVAASAEDGDFVVEIDAGPTGKPAIYVRPRDTQVLRGATLTVRVQPPHGEPRDYRLFARVVR